jgi:hypothetical protein
MPPPLSLSNATLTTTTLQPGVPLKLWVASSPENPDLPIGALQQDLDEWLGYYTTGNALIIKGTGTTWGGGP